MRVVGAGFGRTGTTSLKAALERLGFGPSYSLSEVFANPEHVGFWEAARRGPAGEEVDWEGFLAGYGVAVDWPACSFYEEIMEAFPEASVILTVRDPAPWYESTRSTIYELRRLTTGPLPVRAAFALAGLFVPGVTGTVRLADHLVWEGTFDGRFEDRAYAMEVFERHNEAVRRRTAGEAAGLRRARGLGTGVRLLRRRSPRGALPPPQRGAPDAAQAPRPRRALGGRAGACGAYGRRRECVPRPTRCEVTAALMPPEDA